MASKIGVSKANIDSIVKELETEKDNLTSYISKLDTELSNINDTWKGVDATKYTGKMRQDYKESLESFVKCFQTYIDFFSGVYEEYKYLDDKFAAEKIEV